MTEELTDPMLSNFSLGELIDRLYDLRTTRLAAQLAVDKAKLLEDETKHALVAHLQEVDVSKASGKVATASIKTIQIPIVRDWELFYNYIRANDRFDLLHKRVSEIAWRDTLLAGELIAGTESIDDIKLSLTKSSR